jgi:hypothetical protein
MDIEERAKAIINDLCYMAPELWNTVGVEKIIEHIEAAICDNKRLNNDE